MDKFESFIEHFNKEERNAYRNEKVQNIIQGIKGIGSEMSYLFFRTFEEESEDRFLSTVNTGIYENAYNRYVAKQGQYPVGTIEKIIMPNVAEITTVYTSQGSISKTEYVINETDVKDEISSNVSYEGYSLIDVNSKGKDQLVYSSILLTQSNNSPEVQVSGAMRSLKGDFTVFDYSAISKTNLYHWRYGSDITKRLTSLEKTFESAYKEFSANPENLIVLTQPIEEVQGSVDDMPELVDDIHEPFDDLSKFDEEIAEQVENMDSDVVKDGVQKPVSFMKNLSNKVKDFFEPCFGEDGDW